MEEIKYEQLSLLDFLEENENNEEEAINSINE